VPKKKNIGFNRATADASREGEKRKSVGIFQRKRFPAKITPNFRAARCDEAASDLCP
jgi:hypothetical protein